MGCWNETCDLSKLPIFYEDKVKFLILLNVGAGGKSYYYNDNYIPLALPMSGFYNDYGSIENIEVDDITLKFLSSTKFYIIDNSDKEISDEKIEKFSHVLKHHGCSSVSLNAMNSILNFKEYEFSTIKQFIDDVSSESIYFNYHDKYYSLQLIMYHEDLYNNLVESFKTRIPYSQKENIYMLWNNKLKKYFKEREEYSLLKQIPEEEMDAETVKKLICYELAEPVFKTSQYNYNFIKQYEKYIDEANLNGFIDQLTNYIIFSYILSYGRNGYYTTSGLGSQNEEMFIQKQIAQWILDFYNKKEEKVSKEDDIEDMPYYAPYYGMETIHWYS